MRPLLWVLFPVFIGSALGYHYGLDHRYVYLLNNEKLFNKKLYYNQDSLSTLGHDAKAYTTEMSLPKTPILEVNSSVQDRWNATVRLADYSLKIQTPCSSGTGWFLDYEVPKNGKTYPTKWWIATNAHVISGYKFADNPYNQVLPVMPWQKGCSGKDGGSTDVYLSKDNRIRGRGVYTRTTRNMERAMDVFHWDAKATMPQDVDFVYTKLNNPRLFYVPTNFLGKRYSRFNYLTGGYQINYIKDFAVLEVDFANEEEAKNLTHNFYGKMLNSKEFPVELDLFSDELRNTHTADQLMRNGDDYIFAGYPGSLTPGLVKHSMTSNFSLNGDRVGKLINVYDRDVGAVRNAQGKALPGHYRGLQTINWGGKDYQYWGYEYALTNINEVAPGASGSLIANSKGNVLGILTSASVGSDRVVSFVTPLKSNGFAYGNKMIDPKYDLIRGSEWQMGSYREQLQKYHPDLETYLSQKWTAGK